MSALHLLWHGFSGILSSVAAGCPLEALVAPKASEALVALVAKRICNDLPNHPKAEGVHPSVGKVVVMPGSCQSMSKRLAQLGRVGLGHHCHGQTRGMRTGKLHMTSMSATADMSTVTGLAQPVKIIAIDAMAQETSWLLLGRAVLTKVTSGQTSAWPVK